MMECEAKIRTYVDKRSAASRLWAKLSGWKTDSEFLERLVDKEFDLHV